MLLSYTGKLKSGEMVDGASYAEDRFALARELRSRGITPLSVKEKNEGLMDKFSALSDFVAGVSSNELIVLTKNLSGMLKAGLPLSRALSVLKKQTSNQGLSKILTALSEEINSGSTLSAGFLKFPRVFSKLFVSMTHAGEESGNLAAALSDICVNLEKSQSLTKKVKGALIYPGVILSAMVIIGILMFAFVVPTLAGTFKELGVVLPISTRVLVFVGNFFSSHLILTFILLFILVLAVYLLLSAKFMSKPIDFMVLKIPVLGTLAKELNTARTARTMSSLLLSGVSITHAIEITEDIVQNFYYKEVLSEAKVAVEKGAAFSEAFAKHDKLYPVMMSEMIEVGEETGKLSDMLLEVSMFYEAEIENKTKNLSTIIEPILMVFIGAGVGFFAISMISPLYSILGSIK